MISVSLVEAAKRFGDRTVLDRISLRIAAGDRVVILGPSGAGKSTLLMALAGLCSLDTGSLQVGGRDFASFSRSEADAYRNRKVGFVFQRHRLLPQFNLLENVMVPVLDTGPRHREKLGLAKTWLERAGLASRRDARPDQVSVGEAQRTAILRALVNQPSLLLADEPTGSLDQATALATLDFLLERQAALSGALVLVTHDPLIAERTMAAGQGRLLVMKDGSLHASD